MNSHQRRKILIFRLRNSILPNASQISCVTRDDGPVPVIVSIVLLAAQKGIIVRVVCPVGTLAFNNHPCRNHLSNSNDGQQPKGRDDVSSLHAPGKRSTCGHRADGATNAGEGRCEAVESAEDAKGGGRVREKDGNAREADDDGEALDEEQEQQSSELQARRLNEGSVGKNYVYDWEKNC